jgi:hypothetical protein
MIRFNLRWLFSLNLLVCFLFALGVYSPTDAYFLTFFLVPLFAGFSVRYGIVASNRISGATLFSVAILVGSLMNAARTYYFSYVTIEKTIHQSNIAGVAQSAMLGGFFGAYSGTISLMVYLVIATIVERRKHQRLNPHKNTDT